MPKLIEFRDGLKALGHPVHAALVHFPMGLLLVVFPLELAGWLGWGNGWTLAFWASAGGLAAALPTALTGLPDLVALGKRPAASAVGNRHMTVVLAAVSVFGLEIFLRGGPGPAEGSGAFVNLSLSASGTALLAWGGWLGAELVHGHGQESTQGKQG